MVLIILSCGSYNTVIAKAVLAKKRVCFFYVVLMQFGNNVRLHDATHDIVKQDRRLKKIPKTKSFSKVKKLSLRATRSAGRGVMSADHNINSDRPNRVV